MSKLDGSICEIEINNRTLRFFVTSPGDYIQKHYLHGRIYELEELSIIGKFFNSGGAFVDIGANIGNHSIVMGRIFNAKQIILFEANPIVIPILRINILLNDLSTIADIKNLGLGLGAGDGWAELATPLGNLGGTQLRMQPNVAPIRIVSGDSVLDGRRVDFIKCDVEGMEMSVLNGLNKIIQNQRPKIFIEIDEKNEPSFQNWVIHNNYKISAKFKRYTSNTNYMCCPEN